MWFQTSKKKKHWICFLFFTLYSTNIHLILDIYATKFLKTVLEIDNYIKSNLSFQPNFSLLQVIKCRNIIQFMVIVKTVGNKVLICPCRPTLYHRSLCSVILKVWSIGMTFITFGFDQWGAPACLHEIRESYKVGIFRGYLVS